MASIFWDAHGIIFIEYLKKGKTINNFCDLALLERLKDEIAEKQPHLKKKKVLFQQDNAWYHKSIKTMAKLHELGFELLPHPPYSTDLGPQRLFTFLRPQEKARWTETLRRWRGNLRKTNCTIKMVSKNCMTAIIDVSPSKAILNINT